MSNRFSNKERYHVVETETRRSSVSPLHSLRQDVGYMLGWFYGLSLLSLLLLGSSIALWALLFTRTECQLHGECNDNDPCTIDQCINNRCVASYNSNGCSFDNQCPPTSSCIECQCQTTCNETCGSNDPCVTHICILGQCSAGSPVPGCCNNALECYDGNVCTMKQCLNNTCIFTQPAGTCSKDADCEGWNICNVTSCTCIPIGEVNDNCQTNADCGMAPPCQIAICLTNGTCSMNRVPGCCITVEDCTATGPPTDIPGCYSAACLSGNCAYYLESGHCVTAGDCPPYTICSDCLCIAGNCSSDAQCNDQGPCTLDICKVDGQCDHIPLPNCCTSNANCTSTDPCLINGVCNNFTGLCSFTVKDADGDGVPCGVDCNDDDNTIGAGERVFFDGDGDGYGINTGSFITCNTSLFIIPIMSESRVNKGKSYKLRDLKLNRPDVPLYTIFGGDCNDADTRIFPGSYTYDQCHVIQQINITDILAFNNLTGPAFANYTMRFLKIKMNSKWLVMSFNTWDSANNITDSTVLGIGLWIRKPELEKGWEYRGALNCSNCLETGCGECNILGYSMDLENDTLVSSCNYDVGTQLVTAIVFNLTHYLPNAAFPVNCVGGDACCDIIDPTEPTQKHKSKVNKTTKKDDSHERMTKDIDDVHSTRIGLDPPTPWTFNTDVSIVPPIASPAIVSISRDLITLSRVADYTLNNGEIFVFRQIIGISYDYVALIDSFTGVCSMLSVPNTFPTDVVVKNGYIFASQPGGLPLNSLTAACDVGIDTFGTIHVYSPDSIIKGLGLPLETWSQIDLLVSDVPFGYMGSPHIQVNSELIVVSSVPGYDSNNVFYKHRQEQLTLRNLQFVPVSEDGALVVFEYSPIFKTSKGSAKKTGQGIRVQNDLWQQTAIIYPDFNYENGNQFGGPLLSYEVDTFVLENRTVISYSSFSDCNSMHTVTAPGNLYSNEWFFGTRPPTLKQSYDIWNNVNDFVCFGDGFDQPSNYGGDYLMRNFRANFDINLLYNQLEIAYPGVIVGEPIIPAAILNKNGKNNNGKNPPYIISDRKDSSVSTYTNLRLSDLLSPYGMAVYILNCDKQVLC